MIDPLVVSDPAFSDTVPSVKVEPNTWPNAETVETDEITPLVMDPLVVSEPPFKVPVPSVNVELVMVEDVLNDPDFSVAVPSVNVEPKT